MPQIFVYGTLKSSFANHDEMLKGEKYLGAYVTFNKYPLVITGPWNSPVMFPEPRVGDYVYGEVYEVNEIKLEQLDKFEYVHLPQGFRRFKLKVISNAGEILIAEAYMRSRKFIKEIRSGYLSDYQDKCYVHESQRRLSKLTLTQKLAVNE